ncbi:MAG: DMT family transporter [Propionivibrio sp.]
MAERQGTAPVAGIENAKGARENGVAVVSLVTGALIWGLIWYPYRILRDAGVNGILAPTITYSLAFLIGLAFFRRWTTGLSFSWPLVGLALAAAGCNFGYVLAAMNGIVVRVLLLFYLAPLWTVFLSRILLGERLSRFGALVVLLSLMGAVTILWEPGMTIPVPQEKADWLGLGAGFSFALFNVLSRHARAIAIEAKSMVSFAGVALVGTILLASGVGTAVVPASTDAWGLLVLIGLVLVMVNLVVQYGLVRIPANRAIVIMLSEVGFAALGAWLLAGEAIALREWIGGAMIVAASVFSARMAS